MVERSRHGAVSSSHSLDQFRVMHSGDVGVAGRPFWFEDVLVSHKFVCGFVCGIEAIVS